MAVIQFQVLDTFLIVSRVRHRWPGDMEIGIEVSQTKIKSRGEIIFCKI